MHYTTPTSGFVPRPFPSTPPYPFPPTFLLTFPPQFMCTSSCSTPFSLYSTPFTPPLFPSYPTHLFPSLPPPPSPFLSLFLPPPFLQLSLAVCQSSSHPCPILNRVNSLLLRCHSHPHRFNHNTITISPCPFPNPPSCLCPLPITRYSSLRPCSRRHLWPSPRR